MRALRYYLLIMLTAQRSDYNSQEAYKEAVDHCDELLGYCRSAQQVCTSRQERRHTKYLLMVST